MVRNNNTYSTTRDIPNNSISCFIGRIIETPSDSFENDGQLRIDIQNVFSSKEENGCYLNATASWTLRAAYIAWKYPPTVKYKGKLKLNGAIKAKGAIKLQQANVTLSNVTLTGGAPLNGTVSSVPPATSLTPVMISGASGSATMNITASNPNGSITIDDNNAELQLHTDSAGTDDYDIEFVSQTGSQLPWCVKSKDFAESDEIDETDDFIKAGDLALCLAFGNSYNNLFVVDIFRS